MRLAAAVVCALLAMSMSERVLAAAFRDKAWTPPMIAVKAGHFAMGSSVRETERENRAPALAASERPAHDVAVTAVAIGEYPVTVAEFDRFVRATRRASVFAGCTVDEHGTWKVSTAASYLEPNFVSGQDHPAVCVTWNDANAYAAWLARVTGKPYRLIHEEEWEYAARAGTTTARWWGDGSENLCAHANGADRSFDLAYPGDKQANRACDDGFAATNPVGHFAPNPWGFHDMLGNVWQWTADCFRDTYDAPAPVGECRRRTIRGGSWHNNPNVLRAATRFWLPPDNRSSSIGFRVARDFTPAEVRRFQADQPS